jgi:putative tryptophan/tyrosine transport system substrate-binding protein
MRRREFVTVIAGAVAAWPLAARAQQPAMPVIGFLTEVPEALFGQPQLLAFRQGLGELGWVERKKVAIENRFGPDLRQNASDLVRRNVSVIFATTPEAVVAAKDATTSIPIVALDLESDPVAKGYVKSLARPGGNLTGMFLDLPELSGKQVGLLKEIVPRLSRIVVVGIAELNAAQFNRDGGAVARARS